MTLNIKLIYYVLGGSTIIFFSYLIYTLSDEAQRALLGREDGVYETMGALFFLLSSLFFFLVYIKHKHQKNIFFLLLGILLLVAFLEEISWGQRIFHLETPQFIQEVNMQNEINLHNLSIFHGRDTDGNFKHGWSNMITAGRIFSIFWFMWCVVLPILYASNAKIKELSNRINVPIVPIPIGLLFILTYIIGKILFFTLESTPQLEEIKEFNIAFLFFIVSLQFYYSTNEKAMKP